MFKPYANVLLDAIPKEDKWYDFKDKIDNLKIKISLIWRW